MKKTNKMSRAFLSEVLILFVLAFISPVARAQKTVVIFDGLATNVRTCTNSFGTQFIGEDIATQFQHLGVVIATNEYAIAFQGQRQLVVNTIDNATNRCPEGR